MNSATLLDTAYRLTDLAPGPTPDVVLLTKNRLDLGTNRYLRSILSVAVETGTTTDLFPGQTGDSKPLIAPDGKRVAFLREDERGVPQLAVAAWGSNEAIVLTQSELGVSSLAWRPDSGSLAYTDRRSNSRRHADGTAATTPDAPRLISRLHFDNDAFGFRADATSSVFLIDADGREKPREVVAGFPDDEIVTFTPDGESLIILSERRSILAGESCRDLYRVDLSSGSGVPLTDGTYALFGVRANSATSAVAIGTPLQADGHRWAAYSAAIHHISYDGSITEVVSPGAWELTPELVPVPHGLAADESRVYATVPFEGSIRVQSAALTGGDIRYESPADVDVLDLLVRADGELAAIIASPTSPGEVALVRNGKAIIATSFAAENDLPAASIRIAVEATAADGYPSRGWLFLPTSASDTPAPLVTILHGGPFFVSPSTYDLDVQAFTAAGYAVLLPNFRGTIGWGPEHMGAIFAPSPVPGSDAPVDDVNALLEHVSDRDDIDRDRLILMGGSFGGLMTAWMIAHDDRFAAAVVEKGALDIHSDRGGDLGWIDELETRDTGDSMPYLHLFSETPLHSCASVKTPVLVISYTGDRRVSMHQSIQYYRSLLAHGKEAKLLLFPFGSHSVEMVGSPRERQHRIEHHLAWLAYQVPTPANPLEPGNVFSARAELDASDSSTGNFLTRRS